MTEQQRRDEETGEAIPEPPVEDLEPAAAEAKAVAGGCKTPTPAGPVPIPYPN